MAFLTLLKVASLVLHINKLLHLHTASKSTNKNSEIVKFQSISNKIRVKTRSTESDSCGLSEIFRSTDFVVPMPFLQFLTEMGLVETVLHNTESFTVYTAYVVSPQFL